MAQDPKALLNGGYISLRTFKKDGGEVDTPVWFAWVDDKVVVFTDGTSYKVKRLRKNPTIEVARCDVRGKLLGPWVRGRGRIVEGEAEHIARAYAALNEKYGLMMRIGTVLSTLSGRVRRRMILELDLSQVEKAS
jgi:uncharacterized protein